MKSFTSDRVIRKKTSERKLHLRGTCVVIRLLHHQIYKQKIHLVHFIHICLNLYVFKLLKGKGNANSGSIVYYKVQFVTNKLYTTKSLICSVLSPVGVLKSDV